MPGDGERWLHQSIEAKEGVNIRKEDQTLATITFQNYFRLYKKLSGMTGTRRPRRRVREDLQAGDRGDSDQHADARLENPDVVFRTEKESTRRRPTICAAA